MIMNSFVVPHTMQLQDSKRVREFVFSCFIINYSYFENFLKKSDNGMMWVIYLASFISSRSGESIACVLESLLS